MKKHLSMSCHLLWKKNCFSISLVHLLTILNSCKISRITNAHGESLKTWRKFDMKKVIKFTMIRIWVKHFIWSTRATLSFMQRMDSHLLHIRAEVTSAMLICSAVSGEMEQLKQLRIANSTRFRRVKSKMFYQISQWSRRSWRQRLFKTIIIWSIQDLKF